jgi:hypothetical protein
MQIYRVITSTELVMTLKLVLLESGSSLLLNDAISVSIQCIVWKIFAFNTTPLKIATFRLDDNELIILDCDWLISVQLIPNSSGIFCNHSAIFCNHSAIFCNHSAIFCNHSAIFYNHSAKICNKLIWVVGKHCDD